MIRDKTEEEIRELEKVGGSAFSLYETRCKKCGKKFFCTSEWAYKTTKGGCKPLKFCSWTCYRAYLNEQEKKVKYEGLKRERVEAQLRGEGGIPGKRRRKRKGTGDGLTAEQAGREPGDGKKDEGEEKMSEHWTAEEYREWAKTGREPAKKSAGGRAVSWEEMQSIVNAYQNPIPQEEIERRWEEAEKRGEVMVLEIPAEGNVKKNEKKPRKYRNEPTFYDGIRFDSKHEAEVYRYLMAKVKNGELRCVTRQVRFDLGGGPHAEPGSRYCYIADFVTIDQKMQVEVIDAKSEITRKNQTYINKKKQMMSEWGLEIREV